MINKMRWKLIVIITAMLSVMLFLLIGVLYNSARLGLKENSLDSLFKAGRVYLVQSTERSKSEWESRYPCFVMMQGQSGELLAEGSDYFDLTDKDTLNQIWQETLEDDRCDGVLREYSLRYLRLEDEGVVRYAYADISVEVSTLTSFATMCLIFGSIAQLIFFGGSVILANWAVRPVEQAWEQQRQFVTDASHELKTPLTVIITNAELLGSGDYTPAEKERFSANILTVSRQMRGLVEELLDQARVDADTAVQERKNVDMSRLVTDAVLPFEPVYFEEGRLLRSVVEPGLVVIGDSQRLRQVVEILLDNGCKYSTPGTDVELELRRQGRNHCLLTLTSLGENMTEQECRDIFKRFYRLDRARGMSHSYGLGLSIARKITDSHRGKIWAHSRGGKNTFYVSLPLA